MQASQIGNIRSGFSKIAPFEYLGAKESPRWSFTGGFPDPKYFPLDELNACAQQALGEGAIALEYGSGIDESLRYGESSLRKLLIPRICSEFGPDADLRNVMLTNGAVGAIELAFRAFVDPDDVVIVEAPTWPVALTMARLHRAQLVGVEVDQHGLRVDKLEECIENLKKDGKRPKLVYTIPTFQTPTGTVMDFSRRERLAKLSAELGFILVEDGTYEDLRYDGDHIRSIQSFDEAGQVLKVGSFSKTVAPALRIGWISGSEALLATLASVRTDLGVSQWMARTLAVFLENGSYEAHIGRLLDHYKDKRDVLQQALVENCSSNASWNRPDGGYFFWLKLLGGGDHDSAVKIASEKGIAIRPGEQFFGVPNDGTRLLRIAFSQVPIEFIPEAIATLGEALDSAHADGTAR